MQAKGSIIVKQASQDGAQGVSITNVVRYYLATSAGYGVTTATSGWTTTVQTMTVTNKYLWTYDKTYYSNNTTSTTVPAITGVYGDSGYTYRIRGVYASGNTYVFNSEYRDVILYDIGGSDRTFRVRTQGLSVTAAPTSTSGDSNWEPANELKFIATELLLSRKIRSDEIDVDDLTVKNVEVKDSEGNVTTSIDGETGDLYSKKASFENANIQGKVSTSLNGVRIELDPDDNSLKMYANGDAEVCVINFINDGTLSIPKIQLRNASKVGNNVTYTRETIIRAGYVSINEDMSGHSYMMVLNTDGLSFYKDGAQTKKYASV